MKSFSETDKEFICDIQAPCFQLLEPEEINLIQQSKTQVQFRKGENLTKQGAFASYALFVITGIVKQYVEGEATKNYNLRIVKPGEFVGLSAVFNDNVFSYSTAALTDTQVFLVEKDAIAKVIRQNGTFAFSMIRRYCQQNTALFDTVRTLMYKQMNGRMADALLYIADQAEDDEDFFSLLSRKDIADFAGVSTESAVKILKAFEKDGLLKLQDKNVIILDREILAEISKRG